MSEKKRYIVEVTAVATAKSNVIVHAESKEEAVAKAMNMIDEQHGITDLQRRPIEGIGDLDWEYDSMGDERGESPLVSATVKGNVNK